MKKLDIENLQEINGGNFVSSACLGLATGELIAGAVASTNWWNPAGWVAGVFLAADVACIAYGYSQL